MDSRPGHPSVRLRGADMVANVPAGRSVLGAPWTARTRARALAQWSSEVIKLLKELLMHFMRSCGSPTLLRCGGNLCKAPAYSNTFMYVYIYIRNGGRRTSAALHVRRPFRAPPLHTAGNACAARVRLRAHTCVCMCVCACAHVCAELESRWHQTFILIVYPGMRNTAPSMCVCVCVCLV